MEQVAKENGFPMGLFGSSGTFVGAPPGPETGGGGNVVLVAALAAVAGALVGARGERRGWGSRGFRYERVENAEGSHLRL